MRCLCVTDLAVMFGDDRTSTKIKIIDVMINIFPYTVVGVDIS